MYDPGVPVLEFEVLPGRFAVARLDPLATLPEWLPGTGFTNVTRSAEELSVVCLDHCVPRSVQTESGWRCLKIKGPLDFSLTGVLASVASTLARRAVSVFAISTYLTDYFLVKESNLSRAIEALEMQGHRVDSDGREIVE